MPRMGRKRGNGEGTIYQRGDGRWVAQASLPGGGRRAVYGKTRREAADKLAVVHQQIAAWLPITSGAATVASWCRQWLETRCRPRLRPQTMRSYAMHIERHIAPALGNIPLAALSPGDCQRWVDRMNASGLDADTVIRIRSTLRRALRDAQTAELVTRNAAALTDPPRATPARVEAITPDAAAGILRALAGHPIGNLVALCLTTGLRRGEVTGLRWQDVDLERRVMSIRHALQRVDAEWVLTPTKTSASSRDVPLSPLAVAALERERQAQDTARAAAGDRWRDTGLVFTTTTGQPRDGSTITHAFQRALAEAGLPRLRFHDLRHAYATLLVADGVHMRVVMELLGHSQIGVTMNLYSHVAPHQRAEAADRVSSILSDATLTQRGAVQQSSAGAGDAKNAGGAGAVDGS